MSNMNRLSKNNHYIQIVAPSAPPKGQDADEILHKGIQMLESVGFKVKVSPNLINPNFFYANTLEYRLNDFINAVEDPQVGLVLALRGGSGAGELVDALSKIQIAPTHPKILAGFSDFTALHVYAAKKLNFASLHANNLSSMLRYPESLNSFLASLSGKATEFNLTPINNAGKANNNLKIQAVLLGGNLTVLQSLIGTNCCANFDDAIIILEDVGEAGYKIARALSHFSATGLFNKTKAIIFADFVNCVNYDQALEYFAQNFAKPVYTTSGFGHDINLNTPVMLNEIATISNNILTLPSSWELAS